MVSGGAAMVESWCSVRRMISFIREVSSSRLMVLCYNFVKEQLLVLCFKCLAQS